MVDVFFLFIFRLRSMNNLEQFMRSRKGGWMGMGINVPSVDSIRYTLPLFDLEELKGYIKVIYKLLQRRGHIKDWRIGIMRVGVGDGHEVFASYKKKSSLCSERGVKTKEGKKKEWYHRVVVA